MTKEDALFFLGRFRTEGINEKLYDALGVAIEALNAQTDKRTETHTCDLISRQAALDTLNGIKITKGANWYEYYQKALTAVGELPPAQPQKEIPKRVLWTGWKGCRDTRYKCPNCEKPVRNDDAYCHRCGQRLMFPKISFTDYIPGKKQDVIVRWDDEG